MRYAPAASPDGLPAASPLGRRLWFVGAGLVLVVIAAAGPEVARVAHAARTADAPLAVGHDLIPFYAAGRLARAGRFADLYQPGPFQAAERDVMAGANLAGDARAIPWVNPPFYAWPFAAVAAVPYRTAAGLVLAVSLGLVALSVALLCRLLPAGCGWRTWGLVPLFVACSLPFWQALSHLQNTPLSLAVLCGAVALLRAGRPGLAGGVAGLLMFKPQLGAAVAAVLVVVGGRRALLGLAATGAALLVLNEWTMPGSLAVFLRDAPAAVRHLQDGHDYNWSRQLTLHGFWRLLVQGRSPGETAPAVRALWAASWLPVAAGLAAAGWRTWRPRRGGPSSAARDRLVAAAVAATPLLMPYYMDYDLLLLAVPATLFAADVCRGRGGGVARLDRFDRWTLAAWVGVFAASFVSPFVGPATRLNLVVAVLLTLAGLSIARCLRGDGEPDTMPSEDADSAGRALPAAAG